MPVFSIICPAYNSEKTIVRSICSIQAQTFSNWELILIDDGSKDKTGSICDDFANKDKRIKVIHQSNQGQSKSRINGISLALGTYILFLDSDDEYEKNALQILNDGITKNKADLVLFNGTKILSSHIEILYTFETTYPYLTQEVLKNYFYKRIAGYSCSTCFNKKIFNLDNQTIKTLSKLAYSEDLFFVFNIVKNVKTQLLIIPDTLYKYYIQSTSITKNQNYKTSCDRLFVYNYVYSSLYFCNNTLLKELDQTVYSTVGWTFLSFVFHCAKECGFKVFKASCNESKKLFIYKTMMNFKKNKYYKFILFLFKIRAYRILYSLLRKV